MKLRRGTQKWENDGLRALRAYDSGRGQQSALAHGLNDLGELQAEPASVDDGVKKKTGDSFKSPALRS